MKRPIALGLALAVALASTPSLAWNSRGHMIVAAVAWDQMTPAARLRADTLLKLNPSYTTWTRDVPAADRAKTAFVRAATWPDAIKSDPSYTNDGINDAGATQNIGYQDKLRHKYWHYKDLAFSPDGTPIKTAPSPNAETQILTFSAALAAPGLSDDVKSYDLAWLLHLVGDVHQPLHATARFTASLPKGDSGGNDVLVCPSTMATCDASHNKALHSFWDGALGTSDSPKSAFVKAGALAPAPAAKAAIADPGTWLEESLTVAKTSVYANPIGPDAGPYKLTARYEAVAGSYAEQRAALAGARLANLLNGALR